MGTFDVDLALASAVLPREPGFGERLEAIGLRPDDHNRRSMYWFADLEADRNAPIDLLAPKMTDQSPEFLEVAGFDVRALDHEMHGSFRRKERRL